MRYLKLFEEFVVTDEKKPKEIEKSDKTIDDVFKDDFFKDEKDIEKVERDKKGVYRIKNWLVY